MQKPILRWTIGKVSKEGMQCLMLSVDSMMNLYHNQFEYFVNMTNSGSLDKTILEAMACETITVLSNKSFSGLIDDELFFNENDPEDLSRKLQALLGMSRGEKEEKARKLRRFVMDNHSLVRTSTQLFNYLSN